MLLIPAVLLPITIIFIALSRSQITDKLPHRRTFSPIHNSQEQTKNNFVENYNTLLRSSESKETQHSIDGNEDEDEIRISEIQTSYVPPNVHFLIQSSKRRKRHTDAVIYVCVRVCVWIRNSTDCIEYHRFNFIYSYLFIHFSLFVGNNVRKKERLQCYQIDR